MKVLMGLMFVCSFAFSEQIVKYVNCDRLITLNVSESHVNFTLECEVENEEDKVKISGAINNGLMSFHLSSFLGIKTVRLDTKLLQTLLDVE